jgi:hypothetical protein
MSVELKRVLYETFGGFADKRIRKLERGDTFIIDDRQPHELDGYSNGNGNGNGHSNGNGNGHANGHSNGNGNGHSAARNFCRMFARVQGENHLVLSLHERAPLSFEVEQLVRSRGGDTGEYGGSTHLSVLIRADDGTFVRQLAQALRNVVGPRALEEDLYRYGEIAPRVAGSLERFAGVLEDFAARHPMLPPAGLLPGPAIGDGRLALPAMPAGTMEQQMARLAALIQQAERAIASGGGGGGGMVRRRTVPARSEEQNAVLKEIFNNNMSLRRKIEGGSWGPAPAPAAEATAA